MDDPHAAPILWLQKAQDEPELIHAARLGSLEAFNRLVVAYQDDIFTLLCCLTPPGVEAEAVTQRVVQRMYRDLPGYRGGDFRIWVLMLLVKICREVWSTRKYKKEGRLPWRSNGGKSSPRGTSLTRKPGWDKQVQRRTPEEITMDLLNDLPVDQRIVVSLVDIVGLDYEQAADVQGTTKEKIRVCLARARQYLCQHMPGGLQDQETDSGRGTAI